MKLAPQASSGWRLPRAKPLVPLEPLHRSRGREAPGSATEVPTAIKVAVIFALLSLTVLDRFGVRLSDAYSANPALFAYYGLVVAMLMTRSAQISATGALAFVAVTTVAGLSFVFNVSLDLRQYASLASLALLLVLYAPFAVSLRHSAGTMAHWQWMMNWYMVFAVGLAVAGLVQFYVQFVFHAPWLFDYTSYLPREIRGSGVYNTTNPVGSLIKSNGFFLREASGFSWYMALGLVCEWSLKRRKWVMAVLALALVVSYSGSGLLALGIALLFPLGQRTVLRVLGGVVAGAIVVVLLGDALNLSYTLGRVGEFDSTATSSSAYCRFIMPGKVVAEQIDSDAWTALLGHGPGTMQKMFDTCETTYGKVVFEYGLLGAVALAALILATVSRASVPIRIRVVLVVQWLLLGGSLLAPESMLLIYLISAMWPPAMGQGAPPRLPDPRVKRTPWQKLGPS